MFLNEWQYLYVVSLSINYIGVEALVHRFINSLTNLFTQDLVLSEQEEPLTLENT